jgi:hypothetical protein
MVTYLASQQVMRGVASKDLRWPQGKNLKVYFLEGTTDMQNQFIEIAKEWLPPGEVSLTLDQTTNIDDSHIRVTFDPKENKHEHAHKDANIQWNKDVVYRDLKEAEPSFWTKARVDKWVFEQFDKSKEVIRAC